MLSNKQTLEILNELLLEHYAPPEPGHVLTEEEKIKSRRFHGLRSAIFKVGELHRYHVAFPSLPLRVYRREQELRTTSAWAKELRETSINAPSGAGKAE